MSYLRFLFAHPRFLAFGFALAFFSSFGQTFFISLFGNEIRETFSLSHSGFGLCYSLATLASGLSIIWLGQKLDSVHLRTFSLVLLVGLVVGCVGMGVAPSVAVLVIVFFLLRLTGQGLLSHTAMTSMARYFHESRGKAISIAGLGFPAGEAVLPIAGVLVMAAIGWRQTWFVIAAALLVVGVPLIVWLLLDHDARHDEHLERLATVDETTRTTTGQREVAIRQWTRTEVLHDIRFYLLLPTVMAPGFIITGLFFHQVHLVETKGWNMAWFASCFVVVAATQVPAGLLVGPLVDKWGARRLLPLYLIPMGLGLVTLALTNHWNAAPVFMGFAGLTMGSAGTIVGSMWAEMYGVKHLGGIRAMATSILVFGTAASPVMMGWLIDAGVSIENICWGCVVYTVTGVVLARAATINRWR